MKFINKKIVLGTAQLDKNYGLKKKRKKISPKQMRDIINYAKIKKINFLDTASSYKNSEKILNKVRLEGFNIIGKIEKIRQYKNVFNPMKKKVTEAKKKLKINSFYAYLIHDEADLYSKKGQEIFNCLLKIKKEGLIKKIGISIYNFKDLPKILNEFKLDIIQLPYNLFDRRLENKKLLKLLKKKNIEVHVRSVFLQGLLLKQINSIPKKFYKFKKDLIKLENYSKKNKISKLEICTNFVFSKNYIDKIIIGVEKKENLEEILNINYKYKIKNIPNFKISNKKLIDPRSWKLL